MEFKKQTLNRPFLSFLGPLYQNEVKCSAFDMEMLFHSHANKTHFHNKGCALGLILKLRVFGIRKWPIDRCLIHILPSSAYFVQGKQSKYNFKRNPIQDKAKL